MSLRDQQVDHVCAFLCFWELISSDHVRTSIVVPLFLETYQQIELCTPNKFDGVANRCIDSERSLSKNTSDHVRALIVVPLFLETYQHVDHAHTVTTVVVLCGIASPLRACTEVVPLLPLLIPCLPVPFSDNVL